ncbi:MAG: hypothetical protein AMS21_01975 [Gemmatimonas sp. SG8_38_2]|nr:MAG: hypothetical protein AMS21_01975 [Gemmatimonas sp. SG8_38_2]
MPAFEPYKFQQLPDGRIRPAQAPPASEIYGGKPKFDLPGMFANLFGGGDKEQTNAGFDAVSGAAPIAQPATSAGALPSNNQPAASQGGLPGNQPAAAPALAGAQQPPATPSPAAAQQSGPEMVKQEIDRAKQGAKAAPEKAKQMADALEGTGVDLVEAYNELFDQLGGVEKPETELTKEEKGLFIMSFGLRMMAASETMSAGGAFGAAGVPTVQEMQGLKQGREATAREMTENRRQRALDILSERVRQREGALDRAAKPPATYDSASGLRTWNAETGQWDQSLDPETGQPIQPGLTPGGHAKDSVFQQKYQVLIESGVEPRIAGMIAASNARSVEDQYAQLQVIYAKDPKLKVRGRKVEDWQATEQGRMEFDRILREMAGAMYGGQGAGQQQGGLNPQQQGGPPQGMPPGTQGIAPQAGAPPVGTVEDGYVFKGGDPSDPRNWQRQ